MYSPKIREDLIPRIYHAAKSENVPMTIWINRAAENALILHDEVKIGERDDDPSGSESETQSTGP